MTDQVVSREAGELTREYMASYSSYVAQSRAIPSLVDGLKPVQRRCLTSADDLHIYHNSKFMKSAKLEGQVIGDYHPHGGATLSGLVQPFKMRYPLLEGQGNWGCSDDPSSVAASRYTEVRLTKFAEDFYLLSRDFSDTVPNYDGRLQEVKNYDPPVPASLLTGAEGIAIGLTTKVPVHDIGSLCDSYLHYLSGEDFYEGLYPDTCEPCILVSDDTSVATLYRSGESTLRYHAITERSVHNGVYELVVTSFPPGYSKKKLYNPTISAYVDEGKLTLQNESSDKIRYVFRSKDPSVLDYVDTLLESSVSYKMHLEHHGVVSLYNLESIYKVFTEDRIKYIKSKYTKLWKDLDSKISYIEALLQFKSDPTNMDIVLNNTYDEAVSVLSHALQVKDVSIIEKILNTSIKSLTRSNIKELEDKLSKYLSQRDQYASYITDPLHKIIEDVKSLRSEYSDGHRCIKLVDDALPPSYEGYEVVDGKLEIILSETPVEAPSTSEYFCLYDSRGFVVCTKDTFFSRGISILKDPVGEIHLIGFDTFESLFANYDDSTVSIGDWSIKKRSTRIECKESSTKNLISISCTSNVSK